MNQNARLAATIDTSRPMRGSSTERKPTGLLDQEQSINQDATGVTSRAIRHPAGLARQDLDQAAPREPGERRRHPAGRTGTPRQHGERAGTESELRVSSISAGVGFQPPRHAQEPHQPGRQDEQEDADRTRERRSFRQVRVHREPIIPGESSVRRTIGLVNLEMDPQGTP